MTGSLLSQNWYRVKDLRPRLRTHAEIHRQTFRGEIWYVVEDQAAGAYQRISQAAYHLVGLMDGRRRMDEIWRAASERLGDALPSQDDTIDLLVRLSQADVLLADIPSDMTRIAERGMKGRRAKALASVRNPLALRIPVFDPDRFLRATLWAVRPFMGWTGWVLWLAVVLAGIVLAGLHWEALTGNIADRALTSGNLLLALLTYPAIKAVHELGHAYAVRRHGGEVHEIGLMFLVFMPVPYVDASAASAFRNKWHRAGVAAAGIIVELFLAALAMILWTALEPGLARAVTLNVMLVAGISTLLFNGNPLLRFDGYYVLADLVEIPNLAGRANQHLIYLVQRYLFGMTDARSPALARGEASWFFFYGLGALIYRLLITVAIVLFVAGRFFEVGRVLALWSLALVVALPVLKGLSFVLTNARLDERRTRALLVTAAGIALLGWGLLSRPVPYSTLAEGVVWAPERNHAVSGADGFVAEVFAAPGTTVTAGEPLLRIEDPLLEQRVALLEARVEELRLRRLATLSADRAAVDIVSQELGLAQEELALAVDLRGEQVLRSPIDGRLLLPGGTDLIGRFVRKGEMLGFVMGTDDAVIRAAVPQGSVDLVLRRVEGVSVRLASDLGVAHPARIQRAVPQATDRLPSEALATSGGGPIATDPTRRGPVPRSIEPLFLFDLTPEDDAPLTYVGERVYVRFDHGALPFGLQMWRSVRQLFLRDLNV